MHTNDTDTDLDLLDASDLSPGDAVRVEFAPRTTLSPTTYLVAGEWDDEQTGDLENEDADSMPGMFPGLKVERVTGDFEAPRLRATLVLDASSADAALVDNYPDGQREGYHVLPVRRVEVLSVEDRVEVRGSFDSPRANHVRRVALDALRDLNEIDTSSLDPEDPEEADLIATLDASENVHPEEFTLWGADEWKEGLGVCVSFPVPDLGVNEAFEEYLFENLNDGYLFEKENGCVWSFYYDGDRYRPVR